MHGLGERKIEAGDITLLEGFDFNIKYQLLRVFHLPVSVSVNRADGKCVVQFPAFIPQEKLPAEGNITHVKLLAAVTEIDFEREQFTTHTSYSKALPVREAASVVLAPEITLGAGLPLLVAIGIQFLQIVNGTSYAMKGGSVPLQIVKAAPMVFSFKKQNYSNLVLPIGAIEKKFPFLNGPEKKNAISCNTGLAILCYGYYTVCCNKGLLVSS